MSREIDALVAEAMGFTVIPAKEVIGREYTISYPAEIRIKETNVYVNVLPHHSTDIAAAWQVVEWVRIRQWDVRDAFIAALIDMWAEWNKTAEPIDPYMSPFMWMALVVKPRTICLAFLKAMGVDYDKSYNDDCET
jgi:hypothetical protein